jgi:hypothetical protein
LPSGPTICSIWNCACNGSWPGRSPRSGGAHGCHPDRRGSAALAGGRAGRGSRGRACHGARRPDLACGDHRGQSGHSASGGAGGQRSDIAQARRWCWTPGAGGVAPEADRLTELQARREADIARREAALASAHLEGRTTDGQRIEVFANLGKLADAAKAVEQGAEGCGLLRTEFLFLDRACAPDEDEQAADYAAIAARWTGGR